MSRKHKTQNGNWTENMNEHKTWLKINVSARRWTQSLSRNQENECIALVEFKKVNMLEWVESAMTKKMEDCKFFVGHAKKLGMLC
jgi:hypothetical protein